jgi:putative transposase
MSAAEWNALNETGLCSSSSAHRRFQEWEAAGVFHRLWELGLHEYDELKGLEWEWQALDGAMTKAPLGGKRNRSQPRRSRQARRQEESADGRRGVPIGVAVAGANRNDFKMARQTLESIPVTRPEPTQEQPACGPLLQ